MISFQKERRHLTHKVVKVPKNEEPLHVGCLLCWSNTLIEGKRPLTCTTKFSTSSLHIGEGQLQRACPNLRVVINVCVSILFLIYLGNRLYIYIYNFYFKKIVRARVQCLSFLKLG